MSVYRPKGKSPFYAYDFQYRGQRFHGSTGRKNLREAQQVEKAKLEEARQAATAQPTKQRISSLQWDHVAEKYWQEVGQHHANADSTGTDLARIVERLGKTKLITETADADVADLVTKRRGDRAVPHNKPKNKKAEDYPVVSPATVNRGTTLILRKVLNHAKKAWKVRLEHEPDWSLHILDEPEERVRELVGDEGARLEQATRNDYMAFFEFVRATGLRREECLDLKWSEVNWEGEQIRRRGKAGRYVTTPLTSHVQQILEPLRGHNPVFVFTYIAARTIRPRKAGESYKRTGNRTENGEEYVAERDQEARVKGQRYPLTVSGVKSAWKRLRTKAKVEDFRFHDFRHNFATKLLRQTGNLKLVSRALNHAKLETTMRYAHVLDEDIAYALEEVQGGLRKSGVTNPGGRKQVRNRSRGKIRSVN